MLNLRRILSALAISLSLLSPAAQAVTCAANIQASNPDTAYTDNSDGTVTHEPTGLVWKRCSEGQSWAGGTCTGTATPHTWLQALSLASTSGFAGQADWRLPSIKELRSLVEECRVNPSINEAVFPSTSSSDFWSGSPNALLVMAWLVNFRNGYAGYNNLSSNFAVRLVRGGQAFGSFDAFDTVALTVAQSGNGSGAVASSPAGIDCGATCSAAFTSGTSVTLTATAATGSTFIGWSGACTGTGSCVASMSAAQSVTATFAAAASSGTLVTRYRLYSEGTKEHLYTTDANEYRVLPVCCGWLAEGAIYKLFQGPGSLAGVAAVPYYRLYNPGSYQHHWTTDLNEYNVLGTLGWSQEGVDGYILPTAATGSVPLYRLYLKDYGGLHLWTIDVNEVNVLVSTRIWAYEGVGGYVVPLP